MVIDPNNRLPTGSTEGARNKSAGQVNEQTQPAAKQGDTAKAAESDSVKLSQEAQAMKRLEDQINAAPEVNSARVAEIKQAIAEGRFEIDTDRIAERMLENDSLLD